MLDSLIKMERDRNFCDCHVSESEFDIIFVSHKNKQKNNEQEKRQS